VIAVVPVQRDTVADLMVPNTAVGLLNAAEWFDKAMNERLARRGFTRLTRSQSLVMANLIVGPVRPAELARRLELSRQGVQQLLRGLTDMGLIEILPDPVDRRATLVGPGPESEAFGRAAAEEHANIERALADRIGPGQLDVLRQIISADWGPIPVD
jgi:DNA-binding MarR family transcriptional regulator